MTTELPDTSSEDCHALRSILGLVGDKWSVLIVVLLGDGPKRFNEIKRMVGGISQRMLTFTLRGLERDGLVTRMVFPTNPPRVDYELTTLIWFAARLAQCAAAAQRSVLPMSAAPPLTLGIPGRAGRRRD